MNFRGQLLLMVAMLAIILFGIVWSVGLVNGEPLFRTPIPLIVGGLVGLHLLSLVFKLSERVAELERRTATRL